MSSQLEKQTMNYAQSISTVRGILGLSMQEFADAVGFDKSYISLIERGERNVSEKAFIQMSKNLNVPKRFFDLLAIETEDDPGKEAALEAGITLLKLVRDQDVTTASK